MKSLIRYIRVEDNKLYLENISEDQEIFFRSKKSLLKSNIINNMIDLEEVLRTNSYYIEKDSLYAICIYENKRLEEVIVEQVAPKGKDYICKNLKLYVDDIEYCLDIYINNKNQIKVKIIHKNDDLSMNVDTIYINKDKLNFKLSREYSINEEENNHESTITIKDLSSAKIIAFNEYNRIVEFSAKCIKDNIIDFEIDLNKILFEEDSTFNIAAVINNKKILLKFEDKVTFKKIDLKKGNILKSISVEREDKTNKIIINTCGTITISPNIVSVESEGQSFIIKGELGENIEFYKYNEYDVNLIMTSRNKTITIEETLEILNGKFEYVLFKDELFELKNAFSGEWDISLQIKKNEDVLTTRKFKYKERKSKSIIVEKIKKDRDTTIFEVYLTKEKNNVAFKITNKINTTQILSMKVNGNNLEAKFRTKENIEKLLDNKEIFSNLKNDKEELICKKVDKIGKKTYVCHYTSKDLKVFLDEMLSRGLLIITNVENVEYISKMNEVNKYSIYYNRWDSIRSSKKYKKLCSKLYNKLFLKLPIKKKRVLFESFLGRNVSGNPKYIYNYFVENGMDKEYELIWILNDLDEEIIGNGKKVKRKSLKYYYYMATSGYWVFNARQADEIIKRTGITYLQTWHGTPLKRLASDMFNVDMGGVKNLDEYKEKFFRNSRRWDYLLAQNEYSKDIFQRAFNFNKETIYGYPANDILYNCNDIETINHIKEKLELPKDKKIIIYAPTWREDNFYKKGHYKMNIELELDKMQEALGKDYIVLIRAHYLIANSINIADYKGFVYDFSQGFDIQELYLISDILITDYSSVMFDYANLKRPMIFFTYDLEKYRDSLRGFYFDFEETAPGPIAMTTEDIIESIVNIDEVIEKYEEKSNAFYNKFCHIDDGNAAKVIVDKVFA